MVLAETTRDDVLIAAIGGIVYTIVFQQFIDLLGFAWTVRVMGFIMLGTFLLAFPLLLWGTTNTGDLSSPGTTRKLFDKKALREPGFWFYTFANFFVCLFRVRICPLKLITADIHWFHGAFFLHSQLCTTFTRHVSIPSAVLSDHRARLFHCRTNGLCNPGSSYWGYDSVDHLRLCLGDT